MHDQRKAHADDHMFITPVDSGFVNFITRTGDKLRDGAREFRFISINIPTLMGLGGGGTANFRLTDPWEMEDIFKSVIQMGGTVIRLYIISVRKSSDSPDSVSAKHVLGPKEFNETAFRNLDKLLQLANHYGVRVIIPFFDEWDFHGGKAEYCAFRGKDASEFFTDLQVRQDIKETINYVVNRVNYYTGMSYKDDKAIFAWETGNEIGWTSDTVSWTNDIASYIKSMDPNHLVIDGHFGIQECILDSPDVDIVSGHYYPWVQGTDFAKYCENDRNLSKNKKVFIVGEFGCVPSATVHSLLDTVINNGTSGALIWSMRQHSVNGGFYWHTENGGYKSYHWPGFSSNDVSEEIDVLRIMRGHAYEIRGLSLPEMTIPDAPVLLPDSSTSSISWMGSAGAEKYDIERSAGIDGPWTVVGVDILDSTCPFQPFDDKSTNEGQFYYYRIKAKNSAGISANSNIVGICSKKSKGIDG